MDKTVFEQTIQIKASSTIVERCITDLTLMHRWLNPALRCEPVGEWSTKRGSRSRFVIKVPVIEPTLKSIVIEREPGLVVWGFEGFFKGCDRWECQPNPDGTLLINRFEFEIPNPMISFGFDFLPQLDKNDMKSTIKKTQTSGRRNLFS